MYKGLGWGIIRSFSEFGNPDGTAKYYKKVYADGGVRTNVASSKSAIRAGEIKDAIAQVEKQMSVSLKDNTVGEEGNQATVKHLTFDNRKAKSSKSSSQP